MQKLALLGGAPAVTRQDPELLRWPLYGKEEEDAALGVIRRGAMSGTDITIAFEKEFAAWQGTRHALAFCNGTMSLQAAMFAVGLGVGDEIICPSVTYWASCAQAYSLGATVLFADVDEETLCIKASEIDRLAGPRTKAVMVVHYLSYPADMDEILSAAKRHNLRVIEDVSHAQGGLYKGKKLGTFGDVAAMSLMSGKSFAIGEAGMLVTDSDEIYARAVGYAHYERFTEELAPADLKPYASLALGGVKGRLNQVCSAIGLVQLKKYDDMCREIRQAMNYFLDGLEGLPGIRTHRVDERTGSNMAGYYAAVGLYRPEELGGLSNTRFCEALKAEGVEGIHPGCNNALHTHGMFQTLRLYGTEKPTRIAFADRDVRELDKGLVTSAGIGKHIYRLPRFTHFLPECIDEYIAAFRKVVENYAQLLPDDQPDPDTLGQWFFYKDKEEDDKK